jgi:hypothetical protein
MAYVGYVTDDDRELLYRSATVFAYPVKYEGFACRGLRRRRTVPVA